jgi:hypothetical protein
VSAFGRQPNVRFWRLADAASAASTACPYVGCLAILDEGEAAVRTWGSCVFAVASAALLIYVADPDVQSILSEIHAARDAWETCIKTEAARYSSDTPQAEQAVIGACNSELESYKVAYTAHLDPRGRDVAAAAWEGAMLKNAPVFAGLAIQAAKYKAQHPDKR